jgi:hypothetical protein
MLTIPKLIAMNANGNCGAGGDVDNSAAPAFVCFRGTADIVRHWRRMARPLMTHQRRALLLRQQRA